VITCTFATSSILPARGVRDVQPYDHAPGCEVRRHAPRHLSSARGPEQHRGSAVQLPSLAEYERYRSAVKQDEVALAAWRFAEETRCVVSFERSFMRPMFERRAFV